MSNTEIKILIGVGVFFLVLISLSVFWYKFIKPRLSDSQLGNIKMIRQTLVFLIVVGWVGGMLYECGRPSYSSAEETVYHSPTGGYGGSMEQAEQLRMADEYSLTDEEKAIKDDYEREVNRQLGYD